jgi:hypothetical protein
MQLGKRRATAVLAAVVVAGCGSSSSSTVSPADYVKSVCGAVAPFEKDIQTRSAALNQVTFTNPEQGKKALQEFLGAVAADTNQALNKIKNAGTPDVSNGTQVSSALVGAFAQLHTAMQSAVSQANALPTTSPQAFKTAAINLGSSVRSSMSGIGSSLGSLRNPELQKAAANDPTCKSLGA